MPEFSFRSRWTLGFASGCGWVLFILLTVIPVHAAGFDRLVRQVEGLFPQLQGYVLKVDGSKVLIDLKQGQPVKPGDVLKLVRLGEKIVHPVTKKVIGREETDLGQVEIVEVRRDYSIARVLQSKTPPKQGDGIRSRFKTVTFLVTPVLAKSTLTDTQALAIHLERALNAHPRMEVPSFGLKAWMLENGLTTKSLLQPANLARLKQETSVDFLLVSKLETIKGKDALRYRVVSAETGTIVRDARVLVPEDLMQARLYPDAEDQEEVQSDFNPRKPRNIQFVTKQVFDYAVVDFDVGDLNGDGTVEYVFIDDHRVLIYHLKGKEFKQIGKFPVNEELNRFLAVDVADINGNGRAEIFVTNHSGDRLESFVLEGVKDGPGLQKIWEGQNLYFRIIRSYDGRPQLLAQRPGLEAPFQAGIFKIQSQKGKFEQGERLRLVPIPHQEFRIYGFAQADLTFDKSIEIIVLDKDYKLRVYSSDGKLLVKSDDYYGHDPRLIDVGVKDQPYVDFTDPYIARPAHYAGRLVLAQKGNRKFLLVPKNNRMGGTWLSSGLVVVNSSNLVFIAVNKEGLVNAFETRKQPGYLAAYQVVGAPDSRRKMVHVANVTDKGGIFGSEKMTTVFTYFWK